jgi:hypothetical protein
VENNEASATPVKKCRKCGKEKAYTTEHWPAVRSQPWGAVCRTCKKQAKRENTREQKQARIAARTQALATLAALKPSSAKDRADWTKPIEGSEPALLSRKVEIARALSLGSSRINEVAGGILNTIIEYAMNQASPHHEWAIKLLAERVIPKKLYEDLGAQAAGIKSGPGSDRPTVNIIIQPATVKPVAAESSEQSGVVIVQERSEQ